MGKIHSAPLLHCGQEAEVTARRGGRGGGEDARPVLSACRDMTERAALVRRVSGIPAHYRHGICIFAFYHLLAFQKASATSTISLAMMTHGTYACEALQQERTLYIISQERVPASNPRPAIA